MSPPPFFGGEAKTAQAGANAMTYSFSGDPLASRSMEKRFT
jgi:hypothetical protein